MSYDFECILRLRKEIQEATHEIKKRLTKLHQDKGISQPERAIDQMGISELILYVNELEDIAVLCT